MNLEQLLISKIIKSGNLREVIKLGINEKMFASPECREMFREIRSYYNSLSHPGRVPTSKWMVKRFPAFEYIKCRETVQELIEQLRERTIGIEILSAMEAIDRTLKTEGPYKALALMRNKSLLAQQHIVTNNDIFIADCADDLIKEYEDVEKHEGFTGIPWPWAELTEITQGMQKEEFIVIYSRPKSMKTWIGLVVGGNAYINFNKRVMFYGCEMASFQIRRRLAAYLAGISYKDLLKGQLSPEDKEFYFKTLRELKDREIIEAKGHQRSFLITHDKDDPGGGGIDNLIAKAEQFEPDLIIVDSFYRMKDRRSNSISTKWHVQAAIAQDMKIAAQRLKVPLVGITQKNRVKTDQDESTEDIAYADAIGQEADFLLRIKKGSRTPLGTELAATISGAREIEADGFSLLVNPCTSFEWTGWIDSSITNTDNEQRPEQGRRRRTVDERDVRATKIPKGIKDKVNIELPPQ